MLQKFDQEKMESAASSLIDGGWVVCYGCGVSAATDGHFCDYCNLSRPATKADVKRLEAKIDAMLKQSAQTEKGGA